MLSLQILHIINGISFVSAIITTIVGTTIIPQTVTNYGDKYIGDAQAYNHDLSKAQIQSYGYTHR